MRSRFRKAILLLLIALLLFSVTVPTVAADASGEKLSNWTIQLFNDENGLPTAEANAVLCSSAGYIWIGSYGGLVRYDGTDFVNFSTREGGIPVSGIRALYESRAGILYIGTSSGIYTYDGAVFTPVLRKDGSELAAVRNFTEDGNGRVYAGTGDGLFYIDDEGSAVSADPDGLLSGTIYNVTSGVNNEIWGVDLAGALFAIRDGKTLFYEFPENEAESYYSAETVRYGGDTYIFSGTSGNRVDIFRVSETADGLRCERSDVSTDSLHTLNGLFFDGEQTVWIAGGNGAGRIDLATRRFFTDAELSQCTSLNGITVDYEGNVWMTSSNYGVFEVARGSVAHPVEAAGLQKESVSGIAVGGGYIFVGTGNGLFLLNDAFEPVSSPLSAQLENTYIRCVMKDAAGDIWISTYNSDHGLVRYTPATGNIQCFGEAEGLTTNLVRNTVQLQDGRIAVGTAQGLYFLDPASGQATAFAGQELENVMILSLTESPDGTLYIGTDNKGIYAFKNGSVRSVSDLPLGSVLRTRWDATAGGMWFSNTASLWFMKRDETVTEITSFKEGIGSIFDILEQNDRLFLIKSDGVYSVLKTEALANEIKDLVVYDGAECLSGGGVSNSWSCLEDGTLYLCTTKGLFVIDTATPYVPPQPPKVAIEKIVYEVNGEVRTAYPKDGNVLLDKETDRISVYFSCLHYNKRKYTVKYGLDGFDGGERTVLNSEVTPAVYTNLKGGSYRFYVYAEDENGAQGERQEIAIDKTLKLEERAWFWAVVVFGSTLAIFLLTAYLMRRRVRVAQAAEERYRNITTKALETIAHTIDAKDRYTNGHSLRVAEYSRLIGERMGISGERLENLYYVALLHDIGKIGIPDNILNKPGRLTDEEFSVMRSHTTIGSEILKDFTLIDGIAAGAIGHHERFDGHGYPNGVAGRDNPLVARIISVADAYDAMSSDRPYRNHLSRDYIIGELEKGKGAQFDPDIVEIMIDYLRSLPPEDGES